MVAVVVLRATTMIREIVFYLLIDMSLRRFVLVYGGGLAYLQFGFAGAALCSFLALTLGRILDEKMNLSMRDHSQLA